MGKNTMLKKFYPKEVELKEANNELAKENAIRSEEKIEYSEDFPLEINSELKVLSISIHDDLIEDGHGIRAIRVVFEEDEDYKERKQKLINEAKKCNLNDLAKQQENECYNYILDIYTTLSLEEFEDRISRCETEDEVMDLNE